MFYSLQTIPFTSLFDPCENRTGPCEIRFDHYENRIEYSEIRFDLYENRIGLCENRIIDHCIIETISCILVCSICQELLASG